MTTAAARANRDLAARCLDIARQAGRADPVARRAALCAAVALAETATIPAARRVLAILDDIGQAELRPIAERLITLLTRPAATGRPAA